MVHSLSRGSSLKFYWGTTFSFNPSGPYGWQYSRGLSWPSPCADWGYMPASECPPCLTGTTQRHSQLQSWISVKESAPTCRGAGVLQLYGHEWKEGRRTAFNKSWLVWRRSWRLFYCFNFTCKRSVGTLLSGVIKCQYQDKCLAAVMMSQMLEVTCFTCFLFY